MPTKSKTRKYYQEYEVALINGEKFTILEPYYDEPGMVPLIKWFRTAGMNDLYNTSNLGFTPDVYFPKRSVVRICATRVLKA